MRRITMVLFFDNLEDCATAALPPNQFTKYVYQRKVNLPIEHAMHTMYIHTCCMYLI